MIIKPKYKSEIAANDQGHVIYKYGKTRGGNDRILYMTECQTLWIHVLDQALRDLVHVETDPRRTVYQQQIREGAAYWFRLENQDFRSVCHQADVDPMLVLQLRDRVIANPETVDIGGNMSMWKRLKRGEAYDLQKDIFRALTPNKGDKERAWIASGNPDLGKGRNYYQPCYDQQIRENLAMHLGVPHDTLWAKHIANSHGKKSE